MDRRVERKGENECGRGAHSQIRHSASKAPKRKDARSQRDRLHDHQHLSGRENEGEAGERIQDEGPVQLENVHAITEE